MKPAPFEYFQPTTVEEAVSLLSSVDDSKVLAGDQSLVPAMNFRLARPALIDINRVTGLDVLAHDSDWLTIGALARHRAFERPVVVEPLMAMAELPGPYDFQNYRVRARAVATNNQNIVTAVKAAAREMRGV